MKIKLLFGILILCLLIETTSATILGVSPGNINFENVLRNGYAERNIFVTLSTEKTVKVSLEPRGEIEEWLNFSSIEFEVSRDSPKNILVYVLPPEDIPNGNYTGYLRFSLDPLSDYIEEGKATGLINPVIDVLIRVEITDIEYIDCRARNFWVDTVEKGDEIPFSVDVLNRGNIRLRPRIEIEIWDRDMINLVDSLSLRGQEILPTREEKIFLNLPSQNLNIHQYWMEVSVIECLSSEFLTFDVLEPGSIRSNGIIRKIYTYLWTKRGTTVPINVEFENIGEKNILAQFKGEISSGGKIVQILESEEIFVYEGEAENFTFFFTPSVPGRYVISGRVFYNKKRTFESSTIINVEGGWFNLNLLTILLYSLGAFVILFLIYKIKKERKKYLKALESLIRKNEK